MHKRNKDEKLHNCRRKKKVAISYNNYRLKQIIGVHSTYNVGDIYIGIVVSILKNINIAPTTTNIFFCSFVLIAPKKLAVIIMINR